MSNRPAIHELAPKAYKAVFALEQHIREAVDPELLHLLKLRASITNGCAYCVDMHSTDAIALGEDPRRLFAVAAWRESSFFTEQERAVLALTDAVTRLGDDGVPDDVWEAAVREVGEAATAELIVAIGTINLWNRIAVSTHAQAPALAGAR
jgi:AhpD family alkylhydroperoxidase